MLSWYNNYITINWHDVTLKVIKIQIDDTCDFLGDLFLSIIKTPY